MDWRQVFDLYLEVIVVMFFLKEVTGIIFNPGRLQDPGKTSVSPLLFRESLRYFL